MTVLVTRPEQAGQELTRAITQLGGEAIHHPLIDIRLNPQLSPDKAYINNCDIIIAVSQHAVHYTAQLFSALNVPWPPTATYIGIGQKTAHELSKQVKQKVHLPLQGESEQLIAMPQLQHVAAKNILILRGVGGRELINSHLTKLGANVQYLEVYQRHLIPIPRQCFGNWKQKGVDTIVVTSGEQLSHLITNIPTSERRWFKQLLLLVPSERVAHLAKAQGFEHVVNMHGASNSITLDTLKRLATGLQHDE